MKKSIYRPSLLKQKKLLGGMTIAKLTLRSLQKRSAKGVLAGALWHSGSQKPEPSILIPRMKPRQGRSRRSAASNTRRISKTFYTKRFLMNM